MSKQNRVSRAIFHLAVKTPLISLALVFSISIFVFYSLFVYKVDIENTVNADLVPKPSSIENEYVLEFWIDGGLDDQATSYVKWNHSSKKYKAKIITVSREGTRTRVQAQALTEDIIHEFSDVENRSKQSLQVSYKIGQERIIDKLSRK